MGKIALSKCDSLSINNNQLLAIFLKDVNKRTDLRFLKFKRKNTIDSLKY